MDFTLKTYIQLLQTLKSHNYTFLPFSNYIQLNKQPPSSSVALAKVDRLLIILRHDIDKLPQNALRFAQIEHELGIKGSYYFRIIPQSFNPDIIKKIAALGHEIGYHYEDIYLAYKKLRAKSKEQSETSSTQNPVPRTQNLFILAIESFLENLEVLRKNIPVKTICMHGSPLSKFDNKLLWKYYNYKDFGIIGEPYFDVNFEDIFYLTDTGRCWNGNKISVRDKAVGSGRKAEGVDSFMDWVIKPKPGSLMNMTENGVKFQSRYNFRSTNDIIRAAEKGELPEQIMFTFHPQRWSDKFGPWVKELVWQGMKNQVKRLLIMLKD